jgi:beta-mannosidase
LFPPRKVTAWESHHAFNAWEGDTWLMPDVIEHYFGKSKTLEQLSERGQLLQSEGYKCIFEEARRQKPTCSMAVNWCYNEPWPTAANNSLINWPCLPKPAYYAVKSSCRAVLASMKIPKFEWRQGEEFYAELWILNDSPQCIPAGRINVFTETDGSKTFLYSWSYPDIQANTNLRGETVRYTMPYLTNNRVKLILENDGNRSMNSEYTVICKNILFNR